MINKIRHIEANPFQISVPLYFSGLLYSAFNPFLSNPSFPFLYPLETAEKLFSDVSRRYRNGTLVWNRFNFLWNPTGNYMLKVNNGNTRTRCEICSKLTIKTPESHHCRRSGVLLTLNIFHTLFLCFCY